MPFVQALMYLFDSLISLIIFVVIANAIVSWLIVFNVLNTSNRTVYQIVRTLDSLTDPLLRPIRRFLPSFGGIDISPIVLLLLLQALRILVHGLVAQFLVASVAA